MDIDAIAPGVAKAVRDFNENGFKIEHNDKFFTLFTVPFDERVTSLGWTFWFSDGLACSYKTQDISVIQKTVAAEWGITESAAEKAGCLFRR